jgi:hypothetical protein
VNRQKYSGNLDVQQGLALTLEADSFKLGACAPILESHDEADLTFVERGLRTEKICDAHQTEPAHFDEMSDVGGGPTYQPMRLRIGSEPNDIIRNQALAAADKFDDALALAYPARPKDEYAQALDFDQRSVDLIRRPLAGARLAPPTRPDRFFLSGT